MSRIEPIYPNWPAPSRVHAFTTTRKGGVSLAPFDRLNMGSRTGDCLEHVAENRRRVINSLHVPSEPYWLYQTHSIIALDISSSQRQLPAQATIDNQSIIEADATYTCQAQQVSVVLTADCMPVLFCSRTGDEVAAAHAGWRGLCYGILEETIKKFTCPRSDILAWMGPAISANQFEVGIEVKQQFEAKDANASKAFTLIDAAQHKYLSDLYLIARQRMTAAGITQIFGGDYCTYTEKESFYSYRREKKTGRMASMIWFE